MHRWACAVATNPCARCLWRWPHTRRPAVALTAAWYFPRGLRASPAIGCVCLAPSVPAKNEKYGVPLFRSSTCMPEATPPRAGPNTWMPFAAVAWRRFYFPLRYVRGTAKVCACRTLQCCPCAWCLAASKRKRGVSISFARARSLSCVSATHNSDLPCYAHPFH